MQAKRAPARPHRDKGLKKADACRLLQLAPTADAELITQAYWHLARKHWARAAFDPEARRQLELVNQAYVALNPGQEAPLAGELPAMRDDEGWARELADWLRRLFEQTRARWPGRGAEVATLSVTTTLLAYLALEAGASVLWTLVAAAAAAVAIMAPWRRL